MASNDNSIGASNLLTLLFGVAVGVAGTVLYAALKEDEFQLAVRRTREITGTAQSTIEDYTEQASAKVRALKSKVTGAVEDAVDNAKDAAGDVAGDVAAKATRAKKALES
jgi:hypothetical protein